MAFGRRRLVVLLIVAGLAVGATLAVFATRDAAGAIVFRHSFAPGERRIYSLSMDISLEPQGTQAPEPLRRTLRASLRTAVVDRRSDGSAVVDLLLEDIESSPRVGDTPIEGGRVRVAIAPDGRVLDVEGTGGVFATAGVDPSAFLAIPGGGTAPSTGSQLLFPQYPTEAVRPGDTWTKTSTLPLPYGDEKATVRARGRFDGYQDSPYGRAARIGLTVRTPLDVDLTVAELAEASTQAGAEQLLSDAPPEARVALDGMTTMEARILVLPHSSELVQLRGTTRMSTKMSLRGISPEQLEGGPADYVLDATIKMSIVRADEP